MDASPPHRDDITSGADAIRAQRGDAAT